MDHLRGSFAKFLAHQARTAPGMTKKSTEASLKGMKYSIVEATPRRTGRLQRSMKKSKVKRRADGKVGWEGEVYSHLSYAWVVNQGRRGGVITAGPGKHFVVGGKKLKSINQKAFEGRHMFERGAFAFSIEHGTAVLVEIGEAWIAASMLKTSGGR